ncbi:MAG: serine protease [Candidatus Midichloriaceae bacterium]|jgi:S1-C subfamily serine protease|nr:serine protease [Candidatus Midichloriaceae bacterium]
MIRRLICIFIICIAQLSLANEKTDLWKRGVVSISNSIIKSPYYPTGEFFGTGFIVDKSLGIIATNKHVVDSVNINDTTVTFHNGREIKAKLIYSDPQSDFSFLKVLPKSIPEDGIELKISTVPPKINESVTIIGNNEGQGFSIQTGIITSSFEISNYFPDQTLRISLNARGGSSGSPILNKKGEVIAINYAVDNTFAYALSIAYINDAYQVIKNGDIPQRKDTGAILGYYSLDRAVKALKFPENLISEYLKKFPNSLNKVLVVRNTLQGTPAEKMLRPSDIIWAINGNLVGPNLYELQKLINDTKDSVKLTLFRDGKFVDILIPVYDLKEHAITRMLNLDEAILFETDEFIRFVTGAQLGSVVTVSIGRNSGLSGIDTVILDGVPHYSLQIVRVNNKEINSLDDLIAIIPEIRAKQNYTIYYRNLTAQNGYNKTLYFNRMLQFNSIPYSPYDDEPTLYEYDAQQETWTVKKITG